MMEVEQCAAPNGGSAVWQQTESTDTPPLVR